MAASLNPIEVAGVWKFSGTGFYILKQKEGKLSLIKVVRSNLVRCYGLRTFSPLNLESKESQAHVKGLVREELLGLEVDELALLVAQTPKGAETIINLAVEEVFEELKAEAITISEPLFIL